MTQPSTRRRPQSPAGSTRRTAGFTLIELMIAVAIVGILASIAYPSYQRYITESRRTDAKAMLMQAAGELERCYTIINNYNKCYDDRGLSSWQSENNYYALSSESITPYSYTLQAVLGENQAQSRDGDCLPMTLNHRGERKPDACW